MDIGVTVGNCLVSTVEQFKWRATIEQSTWREQDGGGRRMRIGASCALTANGLGVQMRARSGQSSPARSHGINE